MEVDVKYQSEQQTKVKALEQLKKLVKMLFGVDIRIGEKMKDNDIDENTEKEFTKRIQKSEEIKMSEAVFESTPSLYELSFLKKMISGEFDSLTVSSFQTKKDKRLFEKFNSLNKKQKLDQYNSLKTQLDSFASK